MSDDVTARARAALEGVTEGPWEVNREGWAVISSGSDSVLHGYFEGDCDNCCYPITAAASVAISIENATFIAEARTLVPELLAEVERLGVRSAGFSSSKPRCVCPRITTSRRTTSSSSATSGTPSPTNSATCCGVTNDHLPLPHLLPSHRPPRRPHRPPVRNTQHRSPRMPHQQRTHDAGRFDVSMEIRTNASNDLECDWGVIEHSEPRPDLARIGHLMITTDDYLTDLLTTPGAYRIPPRGPHIGLHSATECDGRLFAHHDYNGRRWTWELFPAHFADGKGPEGVYVGRWPD